MPQKHSTPFSISRLYTKFVSVSKLICVLISIVLALVLVVLPLVHPVEKRFKLKTVTGSEADKPLSNAPQMMRPHFQGIDGKGQPYNILADDAVQKGKDRVELTSINADITLKTGVWLSMVAQHGVMDLVQKTLMLDGQVSLFSDDGYEFRTNKMHVNIAEGTASGDEAVEVQGPTGILRATGFLSEENANKLIFRGPVHVILYVQR